MESYSRSNVASISLRLAGALILAVVAAGGLGQAPSPARALGTTITVDTLNGGLVDEAGAGDCSLAEAIQNANNDGGGTPRLDCLLGTGDDEINFSVSGTITLTAPLDTIDDPENEMLTIDGGGDVTVDGANTFRAFEIGGYATLLGLVVSNANVGGGIGGILVEAGGDLTIRQTLLFSNEANGGGAIYNLGTLNVSRSTFTSNTAGDDGGAIYNAATATVSNSTFLSNTAVTGGGAIVSSGTLTLYNDTFSQNSASSGNGAALHVAAGTTNVYNSILANSTLGDDCVVSGGAVAGNNNLVEDASPACGFVDGVNANIVGVDPQLEGGHGVPAYLPLKPGSRAVDAGDNTHLGGASLDEAGNPRQDDIPWMVDKGTGPGDIADIGAYEFPFVCPGGLRLYVDANSTDEQNGLSWTFPFHDLQVALITIQTCGAPLEVWVADGVYKPDLPDPENRGLSFSIPPNTRVYGGFSGGEALVTERDWTTNLSILSGDINSPDTDADADHIADSWTDILGNNSYHVVVIDGTGSTDVTASTVLDGFTITAGKANGGGTLGNAGGLFCNADGVGSVCEPTLQNLTISGNFGLFGGGVTLYGAGGHSSATITDGTFIGNRANDNGGGLLAYSFGGSAISSPGLTNVTFTDNSAGLRGGGVMVGASSGTASPTLINATITGNNAGTGGGLSSWSLSTGIASPTLKNVTISLNTANKGGGLANEVNATGSATASMTNVIMWDDTVSGGGAVGPEIYNDVGAANIANSIVEGSGGSAAWAGPSFGTDSGNNLDADPLLGALANNGGLTETMALGAGSPAIDAGDDGICTSRDQRGMLRPSGTHCDVGAYEHDSATHLFADVPVWGKEWMEPWIDAFYYAGITSGCGSGPLIYCPENNVTRAEMAVFLLRAKHGMGYVPPAPTHDFADVPVTGKEWMEPWIEQFYEEGITTGCGGGNYCPENNVTRAEMAVFVLRALHGGGYAPPAGQGVFGDVPVPGKEWMEPWIIQFYNEGITTGCGGGNFCPENNVTRAEMAVFIDRAYGLYP